MHALTFIRSESSRHFGLGRRGGSPGLCRFLRNQHIWVAFCPQSDVKTSEPFAFQEISRSTQLRGLPRRRSGEFSRRRTAMRSLRICLLTLIAAISTSIAYGQGSNTGDLHVTVKDPTGSP